MGRTQLNKELNLSYPDEFKVLSVIIMQDLALCGIVIWLH